MVVLCFLFSECKKSDPSPEKVLIVKIDPSNLVIAKGQMAEHSLSVNADDKSIKASEVKWSSSNSRVAKISDRGYVTGMAAGQVDITATLINGKGFAKCRITVYDDNDYKFRLTLKDKGTSGFSVNKPEEFLSLRAIERRKKQNTPISEEDLPLSPDYLREIEQIGGIVVAKSKWLNTVTVHCSDEFLTDKYKELPFVKDVVMVWQGKRTTTKSMKNIDGGSLISKDELNSKIKSSSDYGSAWNNISLNAGQLLHEKGYKGAGLEIAVIDAGFNNLKTNPSLSNITIKGAKSFIYGYSDPFTTDSHGVWVASCMAANKPGHYIGTAPEASYWLLRSEDQSSEYPIEEDYWVSAIEYADSAGVDIVNTSLTYSQYSIPPYSYKWEHMDGKTALATRAANIAVAKGILIVCCAGNDGRWSGTPADSPDVLTVGSVNKTGSISTFTAFSITVDGRMKPDVVALGGGAAVIDIDGSVSFRSGTSYASPIMCGLLACLWQANPKLTNKELMNIIRKSANRHNAPELPYGHGIPDMEKAQLLAEALSAMK